MNYIGIFLYDTKYDTLNSQYNLNTSNVNTSTTLNEVSLINKKVIIFCYVNDEIEAIKDLQKNKIRY